MDEARDELISDMKLLQERVLELEDREAIRDLTGTYMQAMHDARWEDAVECFAEDAEYDHGLLGELRGKSDLRTFYTEFMPAFEEAGGWAMDLLANPVIRVDGDRAEARWFLLTLLID
ncbi:MAG: nuclear transport factor 2 family protein, partial [Myxococcota bacterium]